MCSRKTIISNLLLLLALFVWGNTAYAQQAGGVPPLKDINEIKAMPLGMEKVMQVTRYARHPRMVYSNELKALLDEVQGYASAQNKDDMLANILATKAVVELGQGNNSLAVKYLEQVESYFPKLTDAQLVSLLPDFTRIYTRIGNMDKTNFYYDKFEALVKDKPQFIFPRVVSLRNRTNLAVRERDLKTVHANYKLALKLSSESGNQALLKDTQFAYANALMGLQQEDQAFAILKELVPHLENSINDRTGQFFEILSRNYQATSDYKNALLYAEKLFNLPIATNQQKSNSINRMLILAYLVKDYSNFDTYFAEHRKYGFDPNSLNSKKQYQLAESRYFDAKQNYAQAKASYLKALQLNRSNQISPTFDLQILTGLAEVYLKNGKYDSTSFYLKKADALLKRYPVSPALKLLYTTTLHKLYQQRPVGNDTLLTNLTKQMQLKDSLNQMGVTKLTKELETKYKVSEKEKELQLAKQAHQLQVLELKQAKQKNLLIILGTLSLLILCVSVIYIQWQRKKQTVLLHQATLASLQKQHQIAIMNTLSEAQEAEKKRVAERLHDEVGAMLSIAKLNIDTLHESVYISGSEFGPKLTSAQNLMHNIGETVRNISHALMPIAIEKYGFKAAILDLITALKTTEKLTVEYVIEGFNDAEKWPHSFTLSTYRVIQEIINNTVKHAAASHLFIQLIELAEGITIYIEDNGKGFDVEKLPNEGIGLKLLETNIAHLGGKIEIDAKPNHGTFVLIEIPVPNTVVI